MTRSVRRDLMADMAVSLSPLRVVPSGALVSDAGAAWRIAKDVAPAQAGPITVGRIRFSPTVSAVDCCSVLLALHADAIGRNLDCVFTSINAEGPHQLRVALRRLRVVAAAFEPAMRESAAEQVRGAARAIGGIVSELRDADVMVDDVIRPGASERAELMAALDAWRQDVRGRVRARLRAANAQAFVSGLTEIAAASASRKKSAKAPALDLLQAFLERAWMRVTPAAFSLQAMAPDKLHDLRKDIKTLRYTADMAGALGLEDQDALACTLKRVQDALGHVNDTDTLSRFAPGLLTERDALALVRARLVRERAGVGAQHLAAAQELLREVAQGQTLPQAAAI